MLASPKMSTTNLETVYNEVTHTNMPPGDVNGLDPMYHWDTHYPERLTMNTEFPSPVARRSRKGRPRNSTRFKTQPITFDEIKEVDEETVEDPTKSKTKEGLKSHFTAFSRSMDGLMPTFHYKTRTTDHVKPLSSDYNENQIHCRAVKQPEQCRLSPEVIAACDSTSDEAPSEVTSDSSKMPFPTPQLTDSARTRRQKRFKKKQRHSRSIEEETLEVDRNEADQAVR